MARTQPQSSRQTTWRHLWLAGLGTLGAGARTARGVAHGARTGLHDRLLQARDRAGLAVERLDARQRRLARRVRALTSPPPR